MIFKITTFKNSDRVKLKFYDSDGELINVTFEAYMELAYEAIVMILEMYNLKLSDATIYCDDKPHEIKPLR